MDAAVAFAAAQAGLPHRRPAATRPSRAAAAMQAWLLGGDDRAAGTPQRRGLLPADLRCPTRSTAGRPREVGPSGAMAGVYARTDGARGVWKAPGRHRRRGWPGASRLVTPHRRRQRPAQPARHQRAAHASRSIGNVVWGARTLVGADQQASEWKYIPVRRTALLHRGEPRTTASSGSSSSRTTSRCGRRSASTSARSCTTCSARAPSRARRRARRTSSSATHDTTTQSDIDRGIVNILVGFAPLKPAEFVVIQIQQLAGQAADA